MKACKDCRHFIKTDIFYPVQSACGAPELGSTFSNIDGEVPNYIPINSEDFPNKNGDCNLYKNKSVLTRLIDKIL